MKRIALALATLTSLAVVAAPRDASAWCRTTTNQDFVPSAGRPCDDTGRPLYWASRCVGYSLQRDGSPAQVPLDTARRVAKAAFTEWSSHGCPANPTTCTGAIGGPPTIAAQDLGLVSCDQVEYNQKSGNANIIMFRDGTWPHPDADVTLALTTVTFNPDTGELLDADMEINSNPKANVITTTDTGVVYDLQSIMTHETGHFLGLAHSQPEHTNAVMYSRYREGATYMRHLSPDDVCGICAAYDPKRQTVCDATPRRGFALTCGGGDAPASKGCSCTMPGGDAHDEAASIAATLLGLVLVGARRRRSAR